MTARDMLVRGSPDTSVVWAWAMPMVLLITGCPSRGPSSTEPWPNPPGSACAARVLAEVPQTVGEIFVTAEGVYGVTTRDAVFRVAPTGDGGPGIVQTISNVLPDYARRLVVRDGKPVWIAFLTLVGTDEDGGHRQTLAEHVSSTAVGARAVYFSTAAGLWAMDWPASTTARLVAHVGVQSTDLVVAEPWVLGYSHVTGMWAYNLDTGATHDLAPCPDDKCRGGVRDLALSADRTAVTWHEGPADLIPGPNPRAYRLSLTSWQTTVLSRDQDPDFVIDGRCMYGGGVVRGLGQGQSMRVTPGVGGAPFPITSNGTEWFWEQSQDGVRMQIASAPMAACCDRALKGPR